MAPVRDIASEVRRVISEILDVDEKEVKPSAAFMDDLAADSLSLPELLLALEETFDLDIPDEDAETLRTVQDAIRYVETNLEQ